MPSDAIRAGDDINVSPVNAGNVSSGAILVDEDAPERAILESQPFHLPLGLPVRWPTMIRS